MLLRTIPVLAAGLLLVFGTGCACCPGIAGYGYFPGGPSIPPRLCTCEALTCEDLNCAAQSPCGTCGPGEGCCGCPVPTWGPLSPLFAIFCWGYPDTGCGELYFGDWPTHPRGCQPCDHWGKWVGPFGPGETVQSFGDPGLPADPVLANSSPPIPGGACTICDRQLPPPTQGYQTMASGLARNQTPSPSAGQPRFRKVSSGGYALKPPGMPPPKAGVPRTELVPCPSCGRYHITRPIVQRN
jgi:hypothetical protein